MVGKISGIPPFSDHSNKGVPLVIARLEGDYRTLKKYILSGDKNKLEQELSSYKKTIEKLIKQFPKKKNELDQLFKKLEKSIKDGAPKSTVLQNLSNVNDYIHQGI